MNKYVVYSSNDGHGEVARSRVNGSCVLALWLVLVALRGSMFILPFIWLQHLFLSNTKKHYRIKYLSPSCLRSMAGKCAATIWGRGFCQMVHHKNNSRGSQVISVVNLIWAHASECKLLLNFFSRCQICSLYAMLRWASPSIYISSVREISGNQERKKAGEQMVRKLGPGARLPGSPPGPWEHLGDIRQAV